MARRYVYTTRGRRERGYGLSNFIGDLFLILITGGLWIVWIIIRELSR